MIEYCIHWIIVKIDNFIGIFLQLKNRGSCENLSYPSFLNSIKMIYRPKKPNSKRQYILYSLQNGIYRQIQFFIHERIFSLIKNFCVEMIYYFFTVILYKYMHHCFNCKLFYLSGPSFFTLWHLFMWKMHFTLSYIWVAVRVMGYPLSRLTPLWKINRY